MKQDLDRDISLNFDLSEYLITHPEITGKYGQENFIIFDQRSPSLNKRSETLALSLINKGKAVVKAIRRNTKYNKWIFEVFTL